MRRSLLSIPVSLAVQVGTLAGAAEMPPEPVTLGTLLARMTDLQSLAEFPDPAFKVVQFSSYDRRSTVPYGPDWYANSDGFGREPIPNFLATLREPDADGVGTYLLAEVNGPGAIVRTWTAAIDGDVTVILDGNPEPLYSGNAGRFLGRTYSALARDAGVLQADEEPGFRQQEACYFPIPFARSLRIEWRGRLDRLHFYHVEAALYPEGTPVRTFTPADLTTYKEPIARTLAVLRRPFAEYALPAACREIPVGADTAPGGRTVLAEVAGPAALHEIRLKAGAPDLLRALRQSILRIHFDGAPQPQVEAPLGDFFGSGPGVSPFDSLPMTVREDGTMVCRFVMPFARSAQVVLLNRGAGPVRVDGRVVTADYAWRTGESMHFHAKWRVDHGLVAGGGADSFDLPYLCARGRGVFVGAVAMLLNPTGVPTSGGNWWGEGDEKVWVDDDTFPSLFGTGSEDYFNYAWSRPDLFSHAYCAQPLNTGPGNRGFVTNSRWHVLDALPFRTHLDFYMELMHHTRTPDFTYARLACFYATPDVRDDHIPITVADVTQGLDLPMGWEPVAAGAANGAIFHQGQDLPRTGEHLTVVEGATWSRGKLLNWEPAAEGETMTLRLNVAETGKYRLMVTAALTPRSGRFSATVDGNTALEPTVDLYTPHQSMLRSFHLRPGGGPDIVALTAGEHTLALTARGRNDGSAGSNIGIDFFWLQPVR